MSNPLAIQRTVNFAGRSMIQSTSALKDRALSFVETLPAATAGVLTTRDTDTEGTITSNGHPFSAYDVVDVYWLDSETGTYKSRIGVEVGDTAANTLEIASGEGEDLPSSSSQVFVCAPVEYNLDFSGLLGDGEFSFLAVEMTAPGTVTFDDGSDQLPIFFFVANTNFIWNPANPNTTKDNLFVDGGLSSLPTSFKVSHALATTPGRITIFIGGNN